MADPVAAGAEEFGARLASFVKDNRLYGAAAGIVHGDELVWSEAQASPTWPRTARVADMLYRIASITKTFTGTAILQLRDEGALDLDDPAVKWIPELSDSASLATIGRSPSGDCCRTSPGWSASRLARTSGQEPRYEGAQREPGARGRDLHRGAANTQLKYCNLGYQLLGEIVQRVGGSPTRTTYAERILTPLGMSATGFEPLARLAGRCATGYAARAFSDELAVAPAMPPIWAEGGLWSSVGIWPHGSLSSSRARRTARNVESGVPCAGRRDAAGDAQA